MENTITIKIHVLATADGKWAAYSWTDCEKDQVDEVLYDMIAANVDTARAYIVTAEIPLPQPEDIIGVVGTAAPHPERTP